MDREPSDVISIAQTDAIRRTKSLEQTPQSSSNSMSQIASPNSKSSPDLLSSGSSPALPISRNSPTRSNSQNALLGTRFQEPTSGTGEEWWEVLFEGIGIFPLVQPPYDEEHPYAMGEVPSETSSSGEVR